MPGTPSQPTLRRGSGPGIAAVSAAMLATELVLTRVFSVVIWYHFAFLAVSVALFGTAVAALVVHARRDRILAREDLLGVTAAAFAISVVATGAFLVHVVPRWFDTMSLDLSLTVELGVTFAVTALPFVLGGATLAIAIAGAGDRVHRIYAWDLLGAGAGCVLVIALLSGFGGPGALLGCAVLALIGSWWLTLGSRAPVLVATILVGMSAIAHTGGPLLRIDAAKGIALDDAGLEFERWNSHSHVAVFDRLGFGGWGMSPRYEGPLPERKAVAIDMNALTALPRGTGDVTADGGALLHDLAALVHELGPAGRVCVLGAGAGSDVVAALAAGAEHVTAVEINPIVVDDVVRGAYREYTGGLYDRPDVAVHVDDARAFIRSTEQRFDRIVVTMVDTSAATSTGAYVLTENGLYTTDAFVDYLGRLNPGSVLSVSSVSMPGLAVGARLTALSRAALRQIGADPERGLAVVRTPWMGLEDASMTAVLVKPDGFDEREINALAVAVKNRGFEPVALPGRRFEPRDAEAEAIVSITRAPDDAELARAYDSLPLDISPVTDDRPYFFYQNRFEQFGLALGVPGQVHPFGNGLVFLARLLIIAVAMVSLCLLLPLAWSRRRAAPPARGTARRLGIAALLGLGFMALELGLLARLSLVVGDPTTTLAAVLCVLLLGGGVGSWLSPRFEAHAIWSFVLIAALALPLVSMLPQALAEIGARSLAARAAMAGAMVLPLGVLLGVPLPTLLRRSGAVDASSVPWIWAVNGAASVLGAVIATLVSMHLGIRASIAAGAVCYLLAGLAWGVERRAPAPVD